MEVQKLFMFFFFNDTATTEIYTLSLHDALPIYPGKSWFSVPRPYVSHEPIDAAPARAEPVRSEEHTSELQSPCNLVCRLLLEKKNIVLSRRFINFYVVVFVIFHTGRCSWC